MTNLIIIALLVLAAVVFAVWALILKCKEDMLSRKEVAIEERNEILYEENKRLADEIAVLSYRLDNAVEISVSYTVTESDELKYSSEEFVRRAAVKSMRFAIANDISNKFEPVMEVVDGKIKYVYRFKVMEV